MLAGLVIDENRAEYERGDYLMRELLGGDEDTGAIAVGETVRVGQTLRFHVRDAATADDDLRSRSRRRSRAGRGRRAALHLQRPRHELFAEPDHDAAASRGARLESLAGFFAAGEIGPVGGRAFVHGYTATLAVFLDSE